MTDDPRADTDRVQLRAARRDDAEALTTLSDLTWDGRDFLADLVDEWIDDPAGELVVAELDGRVIATIKLTRLWQDYWWLEALRVHPDARTLGLGTRLMRDCVERACALQALAGGNGTLGGLTDEANVPSLRIFTSLGFVERGRFARCTATTDPGAAPAAFWQMDSADTETALEFVLRTDALRVTAGQQSGRPSAAPLDRHALQLLADEGRLYGWVGVHGNLERLDGLAVLGDVTEKAAGPSLHVTYMDAPDELPRLAADVRRLAAILGAATVSHQLQASPARVGSMLRAGWRRPAGLNLSVLFVRPVGAGHLP